MIIERNIRVWIQLAPQSMNGTLPSKTDADTCPLFPIEFFSNSSSEYSAGISNFEAHHNTDDPFVRYRYDLTATVQYTNTGKQIITFQSMSSTQNNIQTSMSISVQDSDLNKMDRDQNDDNDDHEVPPIRCALVYHTSI